MWREYSSGYIKNNRTSGLSVMIAAFISALLLSLLCGTFYNLWKYEAERIELEEGGWQSRMLGTFTPEDAETIKNFANIEDVVINEAGYRGEKPSADLHFSDVQPSATFISVACNRRPIFISAARNRRSTSISAICGPSFRILLILRSSLGSRGKTSSIIMSFLPCT